MYDFDLRNGCRSASVGAMDALDGNQQGNGTLGTLGRSIIV